VPKYDQGACIAYLLDKLQTNGFNVRYIHPNTLFISWLHWVPSYVRTEMKKKTGIMIDEYGNKIIDDKNDDSTNNRLIEDANPNSILVNSKDQNNSQQSKTGKKNFTPINSYKPSGNLVYDEDLLSKIGGKFA